MTDVMFFDDHHALTRKKALHALIVGVSGYPNLPSPDNKPPRGGWKGDPYSLGLLQLQSAALSAYEVARWLLERRTNLDVPLASIRLLLSPSALELKTGGKDFCSAAAASLPATLKNLTSAANAWRDESNSHSDGIALLYFAGHGIQQHPNEDRVLLLHDFGEKASKQYSTVACTHLLSGMWPSKSRSNLPLRQIAFFDACQHQNDQLKDLVPFMPGEVWTFIEGVPSDPRNRLVFHATKPGASAYGSPGRKSYFCEALLNCLNGGAGELISYTKGVRWRITSYSLGAALQPHLDVINGREGTSQISECHRVCVDYEICRLPGAPTAQLEIYLEPLRAAKCTAMKILSETLEAVLEIGPPIAPHPYRGPIPAGTYILQASATNPYPGSSRRFIQVQPPTSKAFCVIS